MGSGPDEPTLCLAPALLEALDSHADELRVAAQLLAGHPGRREAAGFFLFPHLSVRRTAVYAGPLVDVCSQPLVYDEFCEADGLCSQLECTGEGAGWIMHFRLRRGVADTVDYRTAVVDTAWMEGANGITFETASTAREGDRDWSVAGQGLMDVDSINVTETYGALVPEGPVVLTISERIAGSHGGTVAVAGQVVATAEASSGRYVAVEGCGTP